jgi:hypothetical protein
MGAIAPIRSSIIMERLRSLESANIPPKGIKKKFGSSRHTINSETYLLDVALSEPSSCSINSMEATYVNHLEE